MAENKKANLHMMHAEDCVVSGNTDLTYNIMFNLYEFLQDKACHPFNLTIKYDGAPAIFAWSKFPGLEKPGIAMKGLFNINPVIYTKEADIKDLPEDLMYKLKNFLKHLPKIPANEIWQGDFLFDDKTVKFEQIENERKLIFHPNTIVYVVPKELETDILAAKVGVVWHTRYRGKSLKEAIASYDFDEYTYKHKKCPEIFMIDAGVNGAKLGYFSESEQRILDQRFNRALNLNNTFKSAEYKNLILNEDFISYFKMYQNYIIKEKCSGLNVEEFMTFISHKFDKEVESRKSDKGKIAVIQKCNELLTLVKVSEHIIKLMMIQINNFTAIKEIFLLKLNEYTIFDTYLKYVQGKFDTFEKMKNGEFRKTGQEGFALSDKDGNVIKLVDREEFSYANFSPNVLKGWSKM